MHDSIPQATTSSSISHHWDDESDVELDDNILNDPTTTTTTTSTNMAYDHRQEAFTALHPFHPTDHAAWQEIPQNHSSMHFNPLNQHHFLPADPAIHYQHHPTEQTANYDVNASAWNQQSSLNSTPHSATFGAYHPEPTVKGEDGYGHAIDTNQHDLMTSAAEQHPYPPSATSPQSENGWMSGSSSDHNEKMPKREVLSPVFIDNPPRLRPDGVRKKNARFEIPDDRKVDTIDKIIMQTDPNDETLLRELKQQKRLLRNRQAA